MGSGERVTLTTPDGVLIDGALLGGEGLRQVMRESPRSCAEEERAGCRGVSRRH